MKFVDFYQYFFYNDKCIVLASTFALINLQLYSICVLKLLNFFMGAMVNMVNIDVEVILLGVQPYSFKDRDTGRLVEGVNVYFIEKQAEKSDYGIGFLPRKANLPIDTLSVFKDLEFPFIAKVEVNSRFSSRGVATKIVGFKPIRKVNFVGLG